MTNLQTEIASHPLMEPRDAVKLLYQAAFGCGHLLGDADECARRIGGELEQAEADTSAPVFTPIGRGLCRLDLTDPDVRALGAELIARMMKLTEKRFIPSSDAFERSLQALSGLTALGGAPFLPHELENYLREYRAQGCPVVSHSQRYRDAYHPAYRVVLSDLAVLVPVLIALQARIKSDGRAIVALDGDCGAGKTTLAALLAQLTDACVIHMDDFFLPFELRTQERKSVPGWNVDYERFVAEALAPLAQGRAFAYRRFDCHTGQCQPRQYDPVPVTVIEGSYSHHPAFADGYAKLHVLRVFLSVDGAEQLARIARRDPDKLSRFESEWIPLEKSYFQAYDIVSGAEFVLRSLPWEGMQ